MKIRATGLHIDNSLSNQAFINMITQLLQGLYQDYGQITNTKPSSYCLPIVQNYMYPKVNSKFLSEFPNKALFKCICYYNMSGHATDSRLNRDSLGCSTFIVSPVSSPSVLYYIMAYTSKLTSKY